MKTTIAALIFLISAVPCIGAQAPQKVIKDAAEYNAYITALNTQDPSAKGAAMEDFRSKYPSSIVRIESMEQAMAAYQAAGNAPKVEEISAALLKEQPDNVRALALVTYFDRAKGASGDKDALTALPGHAQAGLKSLETWSNVDGTSEEDFVKQKRKMADIFNGAAGFSALKEQDYAKARGYLRKAVAIDETLQDVYQLSIAELEMKPLDAAGFWHAARALRLAGDNEATRKSIEAYAKAKYKRFHGGTDGWDEIVKAAAARPEPPAGFAKSVKPAPTEAELAVKAVKENGPAALSFSDWKTVLSNRDVSPANKAAAKKVWDAIRAKQKGGKTPLAFKDLKVISVDGGKILVAVADDDQDSGAADLEATPKDSAAALPAAGDKIDLTGAILSYKLNPFRYVMTNAEWSAAAPPK